MILRPQGLMGGTELGPLKPAGETRPPASGLEQEPVVAAVRETEPSGEQEEEVSIGTDRS
jgi:hypothetical protein